MSSSASVTPSISQYYANKSIFVTGCSGFIGKVLIEKLLRSCPDVDKIYMLMRKGRNGESGQQRLADFITNRIFKFNDLQSQLTKLVAVEGDLTQPDLGISEEDQQMLADRVSVIIHSAATVRFHGPLKEFVDQNVLGTKCIMKLGERMKNLEVS